MAASKHLAQAVENMTANQVTALDARAKGLTFFEVAEYAAQHEEI